MKKYIFLLIFLLASCKAKELDKTEFDIQKPQKFNYYEVPEKPQVDKVSLVAVGDNLIHNTVYQSAKINDTYDFTSMYENISPYIKSFDLAFINQETILGGKEIGLSSYPNFNSPHELGDAIVEAGFDLVSIANNHTLDKGEKGVLNAINYLDKTNLIYSGAKTSYDKSDVKIFEKNNISFAFVAYTYGTNGIPHPSGKKYLANVFSKEKAKEDLESLETSVDVIIVSMHWGEQYQNYPNTSQEEQAEFLASLGVDIIIGHHPHVLQPVDLIEINEHKTYVIYSLGNFLSDQYGIDRLIGSAISMNIVKQNNIVEINNFNAKLTYVNKQNNTFTILFFNQLTNEILTNYDEYLNKKKSLLNTYYKINVH